jgi:hypothetical protein
LAGTTSRPPALEFIRVNRPASDMPRVGHLPTGIPTPTSCPRRQPRTSSTHVVSHHLGGLSRPEVLGLLRPSTGQDSLCFGPDRPAPKCSPTETLPTAPFTPFEDFPSLVAVPHHCGRCPLGVRQLRAPDDGLTTLAAFTHPCSTCASVRRPPACRMTVPCAFPRPPAMDRRPSG